MAKGHVWCIISFCLFFIQITETEIALTFVQSRQLSVRSEIVDESFLSPGGAIVCKWEAAGSVKSP